MGNCSFKSVAISDAKESYTIRIMTDSGDILEFEGPKLTGKVLVDFPGYGIFRQGRISSPLQNNEELRSGQLYFLLPLKENNLASNNEHCVPKSEPGGIHGHACENIACDSTQNTVNSKNLKKDCLSEVDVMRMSDHLIPTCRQTALESIDEGKYTEPEPVRMSTSVEVLPPPQKGVWKVKFVINTKQLEEILSEGVNTEALIQQMRSAASSGVATPRRTKINWGQWKATWRPIRSAVSKNSDDQSKIQSLETKSEMAMSH